MLDGHLQNSILYTNHEALEQTNQITANNIVRHELRADYSLVSGLGKKTVSMYFTILLQASGWLLGGASFAPK